MENAYVYLVGIYDYDADMGDLPNTYEFPHAVFTDLEEAEKLYEDLAKANHYDTGRICEAYICKMPYGGVGGNKEFIKGALYNE